MAIAVDFDGTLAQYQGYKGVGVYGEPVLNTLELVKKWVAEGREVWIFTSRVSPEHPHSVQTAEADAIEDWLERHGLPRLPITAYKLTRFKEFWDDRAVAVKRNEGPVLEAKSPVAPSEDSDYTLSR